MKVYRNSIIATGIISLITVCLAFLLKDNAQLAIYYDIVIGIFGGAIVTLITSIIGYKVARLEVLETFYLYARRYIKEFNNFDSSAKLEKKIDCFLNYMDKDLPDIGVAYRDICFLFDFNKKNKLYIYHNIYLPIITLDKKIKYRYWHFKWHKDGSGKNDEVMNKFVEEIEELIFEKKLLNIEGIELNPNYYSTTNKFTRAVREELGNRYYILMYGKRKYKQSLKEEEDQD